MLVGSLGYTDGKVYGSDEGIKLGSTDGKVRGTIHGNLYGITLGIDVWIDLVSLDESFDVSNDGNLEILLLGSSLRLTDGKVLGSEKGIKLVSTYSKLLGTILGNVYGITLGLHVGIDLGSKDEYFDGYTDDNFEKILIGESLGSTYSKVLGSEKASNWDLIYLEM